MFPYKCPFTLFLPEVSPEQEFWASIESQVKEAIATVIQDPSESTTSSVELPEDETVAKYVLIVAADSIYCFI